MTSYYGFEMETPEPVRQREGPGTDVVVILTFEEHWLIDGERHTSFVAGLHERQVTTEHPGRSLGMQVNLDPLAARALIGAPLHELAGRTVPLEEVLDAPFLVERLAEPTGTPASHCSTRRSRLGSPTRNLRARWRGRGGGCARRTVASRSGRSRPSSAGAASGSSPASATRSGCRRRRSRGSSASRSARELAGTMPWGELAFECGFSDQSHLIAEFRRVTGRTPETFLQDTVAQAA